MQHILIIAFLIVSVLWAQPKNELQKLVSNYQNSEQLKHSQWSLYASYVDSKKPILDINSQWSLAPASGLKLFTSAIATDILGAEFKFKTRLYIYGKIEDGVLNGNIYIRGGGDPALGSDRVKGSLPLNELMASWVEAVKSTGIKKINGVIISDDLLFTAPLTPDNWLWVDLGNYYGAGASALSINDNLYELYFKPGNKIGAPAKVLRTEPEIEDLIFENQMKTGARGSGDNGYIYRAPGQYQAVLRGTIPAGVNEFSIKGSLPQPALFAANYFRKNLQESGIAVQEDSHTQNLPLDYDKLNLIHTTESPPLKNIIYYLNKRSFNLYAEQLLRYLAIQKGKPGSAEEGVKVIQEYLEENGIETSALSLDDGSGLSPNDLISTKMMVELLGLMTTKKDFNSFYSSMAVAGKSDDEGFFKRFGKNTILANNCRIKSGLIEKVRSHSGYVTGKSGKRIAFSFIVNNYNGRYSGIDKIHEKILIKLAEQN